MAVKIHQLAVVDPSAKLDEGVEVAPFAVIKADVEIGSGTYVGPHSVIECARIGKNNYFHASVYLGAPPQDFSYKGEKTLAIIGDGNIIREGASVHRGSAATGETRVGSRCMLMANTHVGHDCRVGNDVIMVNYAGLAGHVLVEDKAILSGHTAIHQFTRVGCMCMIGAGSMVTKDIAPYCIAQGDRAGLVGLNLVGLRRAGLPRESIHSMKHVYKTLFMSGLRVQEAVAKLQGEQLSPEARHMLDFCSQGKRGLTRPRMLKVHEEGGGE
ncbi:MAG: acyl-ACP--UDP-N-acetylglucosamine O-acyltransferase [Elusimicrobia bacterium]|nr:acyl-ACP--UDP-N-acetylglucosamine O-acyltransferase [Elusimicrobiota bacterium]